MSIKHSSKYSTKHHQCGLPGEQWDMVNTFIEGGLFVQLRRVLMRYTMISTKHPLTRGYAPSINRLKSEERAHLLQYRCMIHPMSMFCFWYNVMMTVVFLIYFICTPIVYVVVRDSHITSLFLMPINVLNLVLIVMSFYTGYYDQTHNVVVMKWKHVAKRYLRTYFFFDVITIIPQFLRWKSIRTLASRQVMSVIMPAVATLRYARYLWCLQILDQIRLYYGITIFSFKMIKLALSVLVGLTLSIFLLFFVLHEVWPEHPEFLLRHAEDTLKMLLLVNYGRKISDNHLVEELMIPILFIMVGFIFHLIILVQNINSIFIGVTFIYVLKNIKNNVMDICFKYFSAENQQFAVYDAIDAYMRYRALPVKLRRRIHLYLDFKYQGHFYKDSAIRKATSKILRKEILIAATRKSIQQVELFEKIPGLLLKEIRSNLVSEIFLPGDVIIKAGNQGKCMFFLLAGTVVVTTPENKEICYLRDGCHFGEVALVVNIARVANVIAVTPCDIFKLDRQCFTDILKKYPELWREIERMAAERIAASGHRSSLDIRFKNAKRHIVVDIESQNDDENTFQL